MEDEEEKEDEEDDVDKQNSKIVSSRGCRERK
jgi:hypothetical protein